MTRSAPTIRRSLPASAREIAEGSDAELIEALHAGQPGAHEALVRRHGPYLLAVARRFLNCDADRADAVQEAFISAFQAIGKFSGRASLRTWLHRIIINACLMKMRSEARRPAVSIEALCPRFDERGHRILPPRPWVGQPVDLLIDAELREQVRGCVARLPVAFRTVLLLRDIEGLDTGETARMLGVSAAVVKTRLHRARQAYARCWSRCWQNDCGRCTRCTRPKRGPGCLLKRNR